MQVETADQRHAPYFLDSATVSITDNSLLPLEVVTVKTFYNRAEFNWKSSMIAVI